MSVDEEGKGGGVPTNCEGGSVDQERSGEKSHEVRPDEQDVHQLAFVQIRCRQQKVAQVVRVYFPSHLSYLYANRVAKLQLVILFCVDGPHDARWVCGESAVVGLYKGARAEADLHTACFRRSFSVMAAIIADGCIRAENTDLNALIFSTGLLRIVISRFRMRGIPPPVD